MPRGPTMRLASIGLTLSLKSRNKRWAKLQRGRSGGLRFTSTTAPPFRHRRRPRDIGRRDRCDRVRDRRPTCEGYGRMGSRLLAGRYPILNTLPKSYHGCTLGGTQMSIPAQHPDRAKASEHAIYLSQDLSVAASSIVSVLPLVAHRLADQLSLIVPSIATLPMKVVMRPSREESYWWIELKITQGATVSDFFDGTVRLECLSPRSTNVTLLGRFAFPDWASKELGETALGDIAEDDLRRIFGRILVEIGPAIRSRAPQRPFATPSHNCRNGGHWEAGVLPTVVNQRPSGVAG